MNLYQTLWAARHSAALYQEPRFINRKGLDYWVSCYPQDESIFLVPCQPKSLHWNFDSRGVRIRPGVDEIQPTLTWWIGKEK